VAHMMIRWQGVWTQ